MASIEKYTNNQVIYILRHNTREAPQPPSNIDIDKDRTPQNYVLSDNGKESADIIKYYKERKKELYIYGRKDVVTACQWVITAPKELSKEQERNFFKSCHNFLCDKYGNRNCLLSVVHCDEGVKNKDGEIIAGRSHLHFVFMPVVKNKNFLQPTNTGNVPKSRQFKEKLCCNDLINKKHLQQFHPDLQKYISKKGFNVKIQTGITKQQGKNIRVEQLKEQTRTKELEKEIKNLKQQIKEKEIENNNSWSNDSGWSKGENIWEEEF